MIFPFSIKYSARLGDGFASDRNKEALEFIEDFITKKNADVIIIENDKLTYRKKFFGSRNSFKTDILINVEKGVFRIVEKGGTTILTYEFYMYHLFITATIGSVFMATILSVFMFTVSLQVCFGIICFLWLGGMNWLISIIRHKMMLNEIAMEIVNSIYKPKKYGQKGSL